MIFSFGAKKKSQSVLLIEVSGDSVAGAYVLYPVEQAATILYTVRMPVEIREGESPEKTMVRTLHTLCETLIREGAPVLARETGSGSVQTILISIHSPWQETSIRTEHLEQDTPFEFTRGLVSKLLEKETLTPTKRLIVDESIIGTLLNGYHTREPYGKNARRASVVILTSLIDASVAKNTVDVLQKMYHTKNVQSIAAGSVHYQAIQKAFPHEHNALIIDATGPITSMAVMRKNVFATIVDAVETDQNDVWTDGIERELAKIAETYPLPRLILLLGTQEEATQLKEKLSTPALEKLWLSDEPAKIVSVLPSHILGTGLVRQTASTAPELPLLCIALYYLYRNRAGNE